MGELTGDADDLFFDAHTNKVYASGGGGYINMFAYKNSAFTKIANIAVRSGARTSLLIPSLGLFLLAERTNGNKDAQLDIFTTAK